jgi:hypothetical protein
LLSLGLLAFNLNVVTTGPAVGPCPDPEPEKISIVGVQPIHFGYTSNNLR